MTTLSEGLTRAATQPAAVRAAGPPRRRDGVVTDSDLLEGCRRGDRDAWAQVVERYERLVYTVARRGGLDAEDAADVTHATFAALLDALHRLPEDLRLASWLMTMARRHVWSTRTIHGHEPVVDPLADPFADWEVVTALHDALSALGSTSRELLVALYFEGAAPRHAAVASRFGHPAATIGPMRGRCLQELRMIMEEE